MFVPSLKEYSVFELSFCTKGQRKSEVLQILILHKFSRIFDVLTRLETVDLSNDLKNGVK